MKSYNTLIKIQKSQLDEKRKNLAQLLDRKDGFMNQIKSLNEELRTEFGKVSSDMEMDILVRTQFQLYAASVVMKQVEYSNQAESLNPQINKLTDEIFFHFSEMKKIEIFRDKKIEDDETLLLKKTQSDLDEIAINSYIRHNKYKFSN